MSSAGEKPNKLPSRRELIRLVVAASALIAVMTLSLGLDLSPGINLKVGDLAQTDIRAPKALTYTNEILTEEARQQARLSVAPQYDYATERANTIAAEQLQAFTRRATPLDTMDWAVFPKRKSPRKSVLCLMVITPVLSIVISKLKMRLSVCRAVVR